MKHGMMIIVILKKDRGHFFNLLKNIIDLKGNINQFIFIL